MKSLILHFKNIFNNPILSSALVFFLFIAYFAWISAAPGFPDPDTWYHLKITEMIQSQGPVMEFPWLTETTLRNVFVDHHLLYHIALIPFLSIFGNLIGAKVATVVFAASVIAFMYYALRKWAVQWPFLFVLLAASNVHFIFRLLLTKASALAIFVLLLGVYASIRQRWISLFLLAIAYVSLHGGFILLPFAVLLFIFSRSLVEQVIANPVPLRLRPYRQVFGKFLKSLVVRENGILLLAVLAGMGVGILVNPYQFKLLPFLEVQFWQIGVLNKAFEIPVGNEWYPLPFTEFLRAHFLVLIAYIFSSIVLFARGKKITAPQLFFFLISFVFLLFTLRSRRFAEYFVPFAVMSVGLALPLLASQIRRGVTYLQEMHGLVIASMYKGLLVFAFASLIIIDIGVAKNLYSAFHNARSFYYMAGVGNWLKQHVMPGQVVFQTDWSDFPGLFYFDENHYYITGLDPTFMYNRNEEKYWLYEDIVRGNKKEGLKPAIRNNFNAEVLVLKNNNSDFEQNLISSGDFIKVYADQDGVIYLMKD